MSRTLAGVVMAGAAGVGAWQLPLPSTAPSDQQIAQLVTVLEVDHGVPAVAGRAYIRAARSASCDIDYRTLAAVGAVESGHGTSGGRRLDPVTGVASGAIVSSAAARGPMQFIAPTWARWATDGDGDGVANIDDVDDAAASSAELLCASNVDEDWDEAVGSYNGGAGWRRYAESQAYVPAVRARMEALPSLGHIPKGGQRVDLSVLGENAEGLDPEFARRLAALFAAAPGSISIVDGWRDSETQLALFNASDRSGKWVASAWRNPDGSAGCGSNHCKGIAADLRYDGTEAWVHDNAARFGLKFPMDYEPWHIELDEQATAPAAGPAVATGPAVEPTLLGRADELYRDLGEALDGSCGYVAGKPNLSEACAAAQRAYWGEQKAAGS